MVLYDRQVVSLLNQRGWNVYVRVAGTRDEEGDTIRRGPVTEIASEGRYVILPACDNPCEVACVRAAIDRLPSLLGDKGCNADVYGEPDQVLGFTVRAKTVKLSNPAGDLLSFMAFLDTCESFRKIN